MCRILIVFVLILVACNLGRAAESTRPRPTRPPAALPTPVPSAEEVLEMFRRAGLEVEQVAALEDLPPSATGGLKFYTPSYCDGCSSAVMIFDNEAHLLEIKGMIQSLGEQNEAFKFHLYHQGRVLLRMGGLMPEEEAARYFEALKVGS